MEAVLSWPLELWLGAWPARQSLGSLFGMEFSPNGVRRADMRPGQDGQMWGSRGERKQGCSKTWRKLSLAGVQCLGSGVLSLGGRGTVYSKGNVGPWKGKSLCFIFFVDFSLKLVFFKKQPFI